MMRRNRDEGADQTHLDDALQFLRAGIGIVDIEHRDALQPRWIRLAEIGDPVVVAAADLRQEIAVRHAVPEQALARLQHRAPDPVLLVFADHRVGVVGALADVFPDAEKIDLRRVLETLPGLHHGAQGADLLAVEHPGVVFAPGRRLAPFHPRRAIAQLGSDAVGIHVGRLDDVRIGRDELVLRHGHLRGNGCVHSAAARAGAPFSTDAASRATRVPSKKRGFWLPNKRTTLANVKSRKSSAVISSSSTIS